MKKNYFRRWNVKSYLPNNFHRLSEMNCCFPNYNFWKKRMNSPEYNFFCFLLQNMNAVLMNYPGCKLSCFYYM
jgi:hypothetical protein